MPSPAALRRCRRPSRNRRQYVVDRAPHDDDAELLEPATRPRRRRDRKSSRRQRRRRRRCSRAAADDPGEYRPAAEVAQHLARQPGRARPRLDDRDHPRHLRQHLHDPVLFALGQARVHRQREQPVVRALGLGEVGARATDVGVQRVLVDRHVVHLHTDAGRVHRVVHRAPFGHPHREQVVRVADARRRGGRKVDRQCGEQLVVARRPARCAASRTASSFASWLDAQRGLQVGDPVVVTRAVATS